MKYVILPDYLQCYNLFFFCQFMGILICFFILGAFPEWLLKSTVSLAVSVRLSASNSANPTTLVCFLLVCVLVPILIKIGQK